MDNVPEIRVDRRCVGGEVLMIHGARSVGEWFGLVAPILFPFFRPVSVRHTPFTDARLGLLRLFFNERWALVAAVATTSTLLLLPVSIPLVLLVLIVIGITFAAAVIAAARSRSAAAQEVSTAFGAMLLGSSPPAVIAHSFGTEAFMRSMEEDGSRKVGRVIFTGSVLHNRFDFGTLFSGQHARVTSLHNAHSHGDVAIRTLGFLRTLRLVPLRFGNGGAMGFSQLADSTANAGYQVHNGSVEANHPNCHVCSSKTFAQVHNWLHSGGHSSLVQRPDFIQRIWLAELWGLRLRGVSELMEHCRVVRKAVEEHTLHKMDQSISDLQNIVESWTYGITLKAFLNTRLFEMRPQVEQRFGSVDKARRMVIMRFCTLLAKGADAHKAAFQANRASYRPFDEVNWEPPKRDSSIWALHPDEALRSAINETLELVGISAPRR